MEHGIETLKTVNAGDLQLLLQRKRGPGLIEYQIVLLEGSQATLVQGAKFEAIVALMEAHTADQTRLSIDGELDAVEQEKREGDDRQSQWEDALRNINRQSNTWWNNQCIGGAVGGQIQPMTATEARDKQLEQVKSMQNAGLTGMAYDAARNALSIFGKGEV